MSTNATQQFVDLINTDTGRSLVIKDVKFDVPVLISGPEGRNTAVVAKAKGGSANWGGDKRFRYWRLTINSETEFVDVENKWSDWDTEEKILLRFSEWLDAGDTFASDEVRVSTYQLIGQPQFRYYSVGVRDENLKYEGTVVFRVSEPVFDWTGMIFELNGFRTIVGIPEG